MAYTRKTPQKGPVRGAETTHPYLRGYAFWSKNIFWHNDSITQKGKDYFDDSLDRMSKVYNLTKVDQSLS